MLSTRRALLRPVLACTAFLAALTGSVASAGQIVVLDETWVHGPDMPDSHYRVAPIDGTPTDWVNPVDYSQGSAWVYLEVHSKPTDQPTRFQVCFEATPTYACTAQSPTYTEVGVYEWETPFAGFWSPPGEFVDWSKGVNKIACILKDTMNGKPSADNVGPETAALYMPTEVRMVVTIVEPGSVYVPPTPSGEETTTGDATSTGDPDTGDTGGATEPPVDPTTTTATTTTGDPSTTGAEPVTTAPEGTSGDSPTTAEPTTGPTTATATATATATTTGDTADADDAPDSGCACSTTTAPTPTGLALAAVALLGLVRRRRR